MQTYIKTYGCTLNQADSDIIRSILKDSGIKETDPDSADVTIVNTCTVKSSTEKKISYYLDKLNKAGKKVIVTGCMAGANRDIISRYAPNASIITTSNIHNIHEILSDTASGKTVTLTEYEKRDRMSLISKNSFGSTIAKIPISDGCLSSCGFCETKFARGPLNSFNEELIINAIKLSVKKGAKEIELTSQDVGAYGRDKGTDISKLMKKISLIDGDFKVRVGMLNPEHVWRYINPFSETLNNEKFYKFIHLPVQSGSNSVLRSMGRNYIIEDIYKYIKFLKKRVPGITFMTDIIVGYPTETEDDLSKTFDFIRKTKPDTINLSKFTPRPHTRALKMIQLPENEIKRRSIATTRVIRRVQKSVNVKHLNKKYNILMTEETPISSNGRTDSYKQVVIRGASIKIGENCNVKITDCSSNVLYGIVVK